MRIRKKLVRFITTITLAIVLAVGQFAGAGTMMVQAEVKWGELDLDRDKGVSTVNQAGFSFSLNKSGELTVIGEGALYFSVTNPRPWAKYAGQGYGGVKIKKVYWDERITTIPYEAFAGLDLDAEEFTISDNVKEIADAAFAGCSLKKVTIGENVKTIGGAAFGSTGLTSVTIPASVTKIGKSAFGNTPLTSITIPASVTEIEDHAFSGCTDLAKITVESGNKRYSSKNSNVIYDNNDDRIIAACKNSKVPQGTKIIGDSVFAHSPITTLDLPCSLETIEELAFYGSSLTSVKIPDDVKTIEGSAFQSCENLKSIYVTGATKLGYNAFAYNEKLMDVYTTIKYGSLDGNGNYDINNDGSRRNVNMHYNYNYTVHNWDDGVITTEPTTTKEGVKTYTCKNCKKTRTESIPKLVDNTKPTEPTTPTEPTAPKDTHGPNTGDGAHPYIKVINGSTETALFSFDGKTEAVNGLSYDQKSNTLTMKNFTGEMLSVNEMGDDFVIKVEGTNSISKLWVWGYGYCGSVKLTGTGTLNIKNDEGPGIELSAENSKSQLYIDKNVKINISCGSNAIHVSESTHSTPIKFATGVTLSNGKITTASSYLPSMNGFTYACSKSGNSYGFWKDGYLIKVFDDSFALVDSIPWDGLSIPTKAVEKAGYTVNYSKTKVYFSDIAVKKLSIKPVSVAKASIQSVSGSKKAVTVTAKKVSGAKGYQIRYATNKKMTGAKSILSTSISKKITGLKAKTKYYIQVRAYKLDANGKKVYGAWSAQKAVTTK